MVWSEAKRYYNEKITKDSRKNCERKGTVSDLKSLWKSEIWTNNAAQIILDNFFHIWKRNKF